VLAKFHASRDEARRFAANIDKLSELLRGKGGLFGAAESRFARPRVEGFTKMRSYFVPATAMAMTLSVVLSARSDDVPNLDVRPVCRGIANQSSSNPADVGIKTTFEQCVQSEQQVREELKKEWSTFSAADKEHCVSLAKTGGESSNTELLTCLEMARDVRATRAEATASRAAPTRSPSSPSKPNVQPAPAERALRPTSAKKPPKLEVDSTLIELEPANADAKKTQRHRKY
jgi:hypothetical protein